MVHPLSCISLGADPINCVRETCAPSRARSGPVWATVPLCIENLIWGSPAGLPSALDSIDMVGGHSGHVVPVLVDENIQYRIMRYLCSQSYPPYDVSHKLAAIVYANCMNSYATTCTASAATYLPSFLTGSSGLATLGHVAMKTEVAVYRTHGGPEGRQAGGAL